ncbi:MAG TPA: penicillin-binding protein 1C, partial [bacterium]|nr:penicillin-binding protein 1C [bacterium]
QNGKILRVFLNSEEQYCFPPDKSIQIPEKLSSAVITFEDKRFFYHPGVDLIAFFRAIWQNISHARIMSGASTITMQVVRIIENKDRTFFQKIKEMIIALRMELSYTKNDILSLYLNYAPYGGNIFGFEAASWKYFKKNPSSLSWAESALLAVLPNSPALMHPGKNRTFLKAKRNRLLTKLLEKEFLNKSDYEMALIEPLPEKAYPFDQFALHISQNLQKKFNGQRIKTNIDFSIQNTTEELVLRHQLTLSQSGIYNVSAIIAETGSGKIKAWVGSGSFFDEKHNGQIDGVTAKRSTGSILKPFLYALAIDNGILIPETLLKDIPSYFGSFQPLNADHSYRGIISAKDALIHSLNVPAVRILDILGVNEFYGFLKQAGMTTLFRHQNDYGLSLILGGAETNLFDLAVLYRGLGEYGEFSNLYILDQETTEKGKHLISSGASWMTLEILKNLYRPGSEYYWEQYNSQWPIAWKTGTSYGQRDAWAVGVSPQWTIAVWSGNFDGKGNPDLSGARSSGPLLFDIFNSLPKETNSKWFMEAENEMTEITICTETGFQAGSDCPNSATVKTPKNAKPLRICSFHRSFFVTQDENFRVNSSCWEPGDYKKISKLIFPPEVSQYLSESGFTFTGIPPWGKKCEKSDDYPPVSIIYPLHGSRLIIPKDFGNNRQKISLLAAHINPETTIFWYIDTHFKGKTVKKHNLAVNLSPGKHSLEIIDQNGYRKKIEFETHW